MKPWLIAFLALPVAAAAQQPHRDVTLPTKPPRGSIVLFNGSDPSAWFHKNGAAPIQWQVRDGYIECKPGSGDIMTRRQFGDCRLHVEFCLPLMPGATSQGRANSGVYLQGRYEIQVLDSWQNPTYARGGVGAIYGQKDPDRDAVRPPGVWQAYDITFKAARLDPTGKVLQRPRITVHHNGILIHNDVEILETDTLRNVGGQVTALGPLLLQDHGNRVRYRNIWIVSSQVSGSSAIETPPSERAVGTWD